MNNNFKYIATVFLMLFAQFSYSQRLLIEKAENGKQMVIIDTYGMNKDILAVTEAQQLLRKGDDGGTKNDKEKIYGIDSYVNMIVSAKYEIYPTDFATTANSSYDSARDQCKQLEPEKSWRVPTLNEALLMVLFYEQMKILKPAGFELPHTEMGDLYITATTMKSSHFYYYWTLNPWMATNKPIAGYYGNSSYSTTVRYYLRCIRDIPQ